MLIMLASTHKLCPRPGVFMATESCFHRHQGTCKESFCGEKSIS